MNDYYLFIYVYLFITYLGKNNITNAFPADDDDDSQQGFAAFILLFVASFFA